MFYKKVISFAAALAFAGMVFTTSTAYAQTLTVTSGNVMAVYGDANGFAGGDYFTFQLSQPGRCGSAFFHIARSKSNYKDIAAIVLTAYATNRPMTVWVESCSGDRNIISHGGSSR